MIVPCLFWGKQWLTSELCPLLHSSVVTKLNTTSHLRHFHSSRCLINLYVLLLKRDFFILLCSFQALSFLHQQETIFTQMFIFDLWKNSVSQRHKSCEITETQYVYNQLTHFYCFFYFTYISSLLIVTPRLMMRDSNIWSTADFIKKKKQIKDLKNCIPIYLHFKKQAHILYFHQFSKWHFTVLLPFL